MISVVIPAYNEEKTLASCLNALTCQRTSRHFEVIVVNNASTDRTGEVARQFMKKLNLRVVYEGSKSRGAARAVGFQKAKGEVILSTDADTQVPPNWLEIISKHLFYKNIIAVTGPMQMSDCTPSVNRFINWLQPTFMHSYRLVMGYYFLSGFNFGIKAPVYRQVNGFDKKLNVCEDINLSEQVRALGKIVYLDCPVTVLGRRFRKGVIHGIMTYIYAGFNYYIRHRSDSLSDIR